MEEKPPLGVKPRTIHEEDRACDLADALSRYADAGMLGRECCREWVDELQHHVQVALDRARMKEEGRRYASLRPEALLGRCVSLGDQGLTAS